MLSPYWLLSDLDGTLISTPHKAHGQYLPITDSPCFEHIRRWLLNGGNVCIVTTADQRVIEQVYLPLRKTLAIARRRCDTYHAARAKRQAAAAATAIIPNHTTDGSESSSVNGAQQNSIRALEKSATSGCWPGGRLLLSLYTGAVLYLCTPTSVVLLPNYATAVHCATLESVELSRRHNIPLPMAQVLVDGSTVNVRGTEACVRGTCISRGVSEQLQKRIQRLYECYMYDILVGEPAVMKAMKGLSRRYKSMWRSVLTFLEDMYLCSQGNRPASQPPKKAKNDDYSILFAGSKANATVVEWKMSYIKTRTALLAALGILRVEYVEEKVDFSCDSSSTSAARRAREAADQKLVEDHAIATLMDGVPRQLAASSLPVVTEFSQYMCRLLGTDARDLKIRTSSAAAAAAGDADSTALLARQDIAQVILLGLPLPLFSQYFSKSMSDFVCCGVNAMPQPNSVVFSKMGVSKSTALRYLLGKDRISMDHLGHEEQEWSDTHGDGDSLQGSVCPMHAIALGDNPQSTDYELTVFDDVAFMSVEKDSQRSERHARIARRLTRAKSLEVSGKLALMPDGSQAPTYAALTASLTKSGPMMDDRERQNIAFVGGEEDGTAVLLRSAMDHLAVPQLSESFKTPVKGTAAPVPVDAFREALGVAKASARQKVQLTVTQRSSNL